MSIWLKKDFSLDQLNQKNKNNLSEHLGMKFTEIGDNYLKATMPVDDRTRQPLGLLHGGASVALAETLGSVASALMIDTDRNICVGLEINANHVRGVRSGFVTGSAKPIHIGAATHVWEIKIHDEKEKLICVSRITIMILAKK